MAIELLQRIKILKVISQDDHTASQLCIRRYLHKWEHTRGMRTQGEWQLPKDIVAERAFAFSYLSDQNTSAMRAFWDTSNGTSKQTDLLSKEKMHEGKGMLSNQSLEWIYFVTYRCRNKLQLMREAVGFFSRYLSRRKGPSRNSCQSINHKNWSLEGSMLVNWKDWTALNWT